VWFRAFLHRSPADIIEAVKNSDMDPRHNHLDDLIKDWTP
jgi:hypothetical protein